MTRGASNSARPYRSHARPACTACRRRKSRCTADAGALVCLMCKVHGTQCSFQHDTEDSADGESRPAAKRPRIASRQDRRPLPSAGQTSTGVPRHSGLSGIPGLAQSSPETREGNIISTAAPQPGSGETPIPLHPADDDDSPHILGPAVTGDSHVLADYLSNVRDGRRAIPIIRPMLGGDAEPVIFTKVKKRPLGMVVDPTPPSLQLHMIQKLVEPWEERLVEVFLSKVNICFPLVDEASFRNQFLHARDRISPGLLATVYAHALTYWPHDPELSKQRSPDGRFAWNLANQILFSELRHSPGISTLPAMLLDVGGRPTTSMIGNGMLLGCSVSLSHSLGLNRNPLSWNIPQSEKYLRMKLWWCLVVHDRWCSLAHGTPPRLRSCQYDVPSPTLDYLLGDQHSRREKQAASVFIALVSLSELLESFLDHVYSLRPIVGTSSQDFELALDQWVDGLADGVRRIIVRGLGLETPGAPNLRLAYLSARLLLRRIELDQSKKAASESVSFLSARYMQVRRTAEDIVSLVQELGESQLGDFWLPVAGFTFSHAVTFLIRCALETAHDYSTLAQNPSLKLANELIEALQAHQERHTWDLADICVAQHSEVVARLLTEEAPDDGYADAFLSSQELSMLDFPFLDDMLPYTNADLFNV